MSPTAGPDVGMHVTWGLEEPSTTIPSGVDLLTILVYVGDDPTPMDSASTVENLMDADENGRDEVTRANLPTGEELRVVVRGTGPSGNLLYVGHAGPFVLEPGERRYIDLRMLPVGDYGPVDAGVLTGRFLHTATTLPDGRVLIAGGFTRAMSTTCPATSPAMTRCFDLTGNSEAFVYDPATARFFSVQGGMRQARGGHTATLLGDGRVLVAGGAARAMLLLTPQTAASELVPSFVAMDDGGAAATSFELFLPDDHAEDFDVDRNGDPGRGGFVGAADAPTTLGRLDRARFLHSASTIPGSPNRVVLAGGLAPSAAASWAVFDADRAGGYGVLDSTTTALGASRTMPSTVTIGAAGHESLWILGGGEALSNAELADRYSPMGGNGNGTTVPAGTMNMFPGTMPRPELGLWRPTAYPLGDGTHAIVVGWLGPACVSGTTTPVFPTDPVAYDRCGAGTMTRSYTMADTGLATATPVVTPHAFGAGARLSDGSVLVSGGFTGLNLATSMVTSLFAPNVTTAGIAMETATHPMLRAARAFHTVSALEDRGVLTVGGMGLGSDGASIAITAAPEVLYLP
jgi:hypothetical protein